MIGSTVTWFNQDTRIDYTGIVRDKYVDYFTINHGVYTSIEYYIIEDSYKSLWHVKCRDVRGIIRHKLNFNPKIKWQ